ncbi:outer membrane protein assembly factor BamE [Marinobacter xestospongiae]|uniref:Outer membrane protein assembly factor BamE n=1 Tax=Marinobacter xestospongiae TaxID=994319 RepID=A0ABU3VX56_9GAMM|nr:outer membrane protein assembly factor BamE [Marinobacter xestospongiae]MDV2078834.1 outer membrane protein assembly factor BamE [Marinobacter xestospongiae]
MPATAPARADRPWRRLSRAVRVGSLVTAGLLCSGAGAEPVYRCDNGNGVTFADQPCGDDATRIQVPDNRLGGRLDSNLPRDDVEPKPPPEATPPVPDSVDDSPCRYINSTQLRTYLARNQVVRGMTREQVRKAFGPPPETHSVPQEAWVYHTDYYGRLYELTFVYFRDGCVDSVQYRKP